MQSDGKSTEFAKSCAFFRWIASHGHFWNESHWNLNFFFSNTSRWLPVKSVTLPLIQCFPRLSHLFSLSFNLSRGFFNKILIWKKWRTRIMNAPRGLMAKTNAHVHTTLSAYSDCLVELMHWIAWLWKYLIRKWSYLQLMQPCVRLAQYK